MVPLEVVFVLVIVIWGGIGVVRGFAKEAGSSIAIVLALEITSRIGPGVLSKINAGAKFLSLTDKDLIPPAPAANQFWFYSLVFLGLTFLGYQGETFALKGGLAKIPEQIVGLFLGLANGYLIAGTLWYFLHYYASYNVPALHIQGQLSHTAQQLLNFLPYNVLREPFLLGLLFLLLVLRIAK